MKKLLIEFLLNQFIKKIIHQQRLLFFLSQPKRNDLSKH